MAMASALQNNINEQTNKNRQLHKKMPVSQLEEILDKNCEIREYDFLCNVYDLV